jgi:hypothetical protein
LVLHSLSNGQTVTAAAKAGNVSRDTVYRWLKKDPTFIADLNRARFEQRQVVEAVLREGAIRAAKFLVSVIEDKEAPSWQKMQASCVLMGEFRRRGVPETDPAKVQSMLDLNFLSLENDRL